MITACNVRQPRSKIKELYDSRTHPVLVLPLTPVTTDLWEAARQSGLSGVILG